MNAIEAFQGLGQASTSYPSWSGSAGLGSGEAEAVDREEPSFSSFAVSQVGGTRQTRLQTHPATVFTAPRKRQPEKPAASRQTDERSSAGGETILVVDDVDGVRELICEVLEMQGYEVLLARNGLEALQVVENYSRPVDLLLTDVVMPRMGGQELAHSLSSRWPETKIIFMSGYSDEAISRQGVLKEGTAFIKKPFTADSLTRHIRRELDS